MSRVLKRSTPLTSATCRYRSQQSLLQQLATFSINDTSNTLTTSRRSFSSYNPSISHTSHSSLYVSNAAASSSSSTSTSCFRTRFVVRRRAHQQTRYESTFRRHRKLLNLPPSPAFGGPSMPTGASGRSRTALQPRPEVDHIIFDPAPSAPNPYHTPMKFLPKDDVRRVMYERQMARQSQLSSTPNSSSLGTAASAASSTVATDAAEAEAATGQTARETDPASLGSLPTPFWAHNSGRRSSSSSSSSSLSPAQTEARVIATIGPGISPASAFGGQSPISNTSWPEGTDLPPALWNSDQYKKSYHLGPEEIEEIRQLRSVDPETWTRTKLAQKFKCSKIFIAMIVHAPAQLRARNHERINKARARASLRYTLTAMNRQKRKERIQRDE